MKYILKRIGRSVEISEATSSLLVYRIPYQNLSVGADEPIKIKNKFIVSDADNVADDTASGSVSDGIYNMSWKTNLE